MSSGAAPILSEPVVNGKLIGSDNGTWYCGFGLGAAAAAIVRVREKSATGKILDPIYLLAGASINVCYQDPWIYCDGKIYIEIANGAPEGCIRWK